MSQKSSLYRTIWRDFELIKDVPRSLKKLVKKSLERKLKRLLDSN